MLKHPRYIYPSMIVDLYISLEILTILLHKIRGCAASYAQLQNHYILHKHVPLGAPGWLSP